MVCLPVLRFFHLTRIVGLAAVLTPCLLSVACAEEGAEEGATTSVPVQLSPVRLTGATVIGPEGASSQDLAFENGILLDPDIKSEVAATDVTDKWITPAFIDSHIHIAYLPVSSELVEGGVAAAVDLAAPEDQIGSETDMLSVLWAGPMVTAIDGYPTQSWGSNGYGTEVADTQEAVAAVERLVTLGAGVIKVPLTTSTSLKSTTIAAIVETAHTHDVHVVTHAMQDETALSARNAGIDALVHTPTEALSEETIAAWSDGVVISTLSAMGSTKTATENLSRLHTAGATILYGTDLGNTREQGISERELELMAQAGLSGAEIVGSATWTAAQWWGMDDLGQLESGRKASFLVYDSDPRADVTTLAHPSQVWINGVQVR